MRRSSLGACLATLTLAGAVAAGDGCGHARTVEPAVPPAEAKEADKTTEKTAEKKTAATFTSRHATSDESEGTAAVRLSTSPEALLKPGALARIQEKLAHEGTLNGEPTGKMDAATKKGLEDFQRDHDLPATGIPDDATVGRLGLKPTDVFRQGTP
jgi:peptidoglycan hydrolase-like protein with peptidoglycan-binding domain